MEDQRISMWSRSIGWQQGSFLTPETISLLVQQEKIPKTENQCVVVVSHDCDVANQDLGDEPNIELIYGFVLPQINGNYSWSKSPRTLHLDAQWKGQSKYIELKSTKKFSLEKEWLGNHLPDSAWCLSQVAKNTLRSWLAVRYNRAAYPDDFNDILDKKKLKKGIVKILEPTQRLFSGLYLTLDEGSDSRGHKLYNLNLFLIYSAGDEPLEAMQEAERVEDKISKLFKDKCFDSSTQVWTGIQLEDCVVMLEDEVKLGWLNKLSEWRLEHLSLKDEN
jgi:hypothetical protein